MATRDLTGRYRKLRQGFYKNTPSSALPTHYLNEGVQPVWVDIVKNVEEQVATIEDLIEKLHEAHKNRLMVRFDDETDGARDREIDELTTKIGRTFNFARRQLEQIGQSGSNADEEAVCKNIQRTIASRLQNLSLNFRKSQKQYMTRLKHIKSGKSPIFDIDPEEGMDDSRPSGSGIQLSEGELLVLEDEQVNLRERDKEIQKIADSIGELATIFRELAVLVIEQGTILDRIDYNMDMVVDTTKHAVEELKKTEKIQKQARPQKCIFILVIIIFILLIILAYKHS